MTICPSVASLALLGVFLAFMATGIIVIAVTYLRGAIYLSHLQELILAMLAVYSVPLGTILGGIFGQRSDLDRPTPNFAFWAALAVAAIWNLLLFARVLIFCVASDDSVADLKSYIGVVAAASSFLVTGALAYFFTKKEPN